MHAYRDDFSFFTTNPGITYLDSAATTQKPRVVVATVVKALESTAPIGRSTYPLAEQISEQYESARLTIADFFSVPSQQLVLTPSATISSNILALGLSSWLKRGDEILVGEAEHHSNLLPWRNTAEKTGAALYSIPGEDGSYTIESLSPLLNENTKVVAFSHASNTTGALTDVESLFALCKEKSPQALIIVDCCQTAAHMQLLPTQFADAIITAGHKLYGPTGSAALWITERLEKILEPVITGGGIVQGVTSNSSTLIQSSRRFEAGSPAAESVLGFAAALDYLSEIGWPTISSHCIEVTNYLITSLKTLPFVSILGNPNPAVGLVGFTIDTCHPHDIAALIGEEGVCLRAGQHCAGPLHEKLGVGASLRASCGIYTTTDDIDRLIHSLNNAYSKLNA